MIVVHVQRLVVRMFGVADLAAAALRFEQSSELARLETVPRLLPTTALLRSQLQRVPRLLDEPSSAGQGVHGVLIVARERSKSAIRARNLP